MAKKLPRRRRTLLARPEPVATDQTTGRIYRNGTYLRRNPGWHSEDSPWKARRILDLMARNDLRPSSVCELGCGAGEILLELSSECDEGVRFVGYETAPEAFALCRQDARPNVTFRQEDLLEDAGASFALVLAIDVFEHVEDYLGFLRRLRPKGRHKIFHIPLDISVQSVLRPSRLLREREQVGHLHYFTRETALATLEDLGYRILDWTYTAGSLELPNRGALANLARLPRKLLFWMNRDLAARLLGGFSLLVLTE